MEGYSLLDTLENVGSLNESIICKIAIQMVQCFQEYYEKFNENYGDICPCDVMFDKKGGLKVNNT